MPIILRRTIWPVGHGAFYTEQFIDEDTKKVLWTAVYDCGDNSAKFEETPALIVSRVDAFLSSLQKLQNSKPIVDYVFISHFHADHVNGLSYLLKKSVVRHLIIPQITIDVALEAELRNISFLNENDLNQYITSKGILERIQNKIRNPQVGDDDLRETQITQVLAADVDGSDYKDLATEEDGRPRLLDKISSGTSITPYNPNKEKDSYLWHYIPVNIICKNGLIDKIKANEDLKDIVTGDILDYQKLKETLQDTGKITKLKGIYLEEFSRNINQSSMPLYSGSDCWWHLRDLHAIVYGEKNIMNDIYNHFSSKIRYICPYLPKRVFCPSTSTNCLYMGDFCLRQYKQTISNVSVLQKMLMPYWLLTGMQQVPHHGSYPNHTLAYYSWPKLCFVNQDSDEKNCANPDLTEKEIKNSDGFILKVTEQDNSKIECIYQI